jgi:hypothetical protein
VEVRIMDDSLAVTLAFVFIIAGVLLGLILGWIGLSGR